MLSTPSSPSFTPPCGVCARPSLLPNRPTPLTTHTPAVSPTRIATAAVAAAVSGAGAVPAASRPDRTPCGQADALTLALMPYHHLTHAQPGPLMLLMLLLLLLLLLLLQASYLCWSS